MASLFTPDLFTASDLTAAVNKIPWQPSLLAPFFEQDSVRTSTCIVDVEEDHLTLIADSKRGSVGKPATASTRKAVAIPAAHLSQVGAILPEDVQDVRAFGSTEPETVANRLAKKLAILRRNVEVTLEWQRVGAVKGQVLDADGSTVLYDLYNTFGVTKATDIALTWPTATTGKTNPVLEAVQNAVYHVEDAMGGSPITAIHAICGRDFWQKLIGNPYCREAYNLWSARQDALGGDSYFGTGFTYGGIVFHRYSRTVGGNALVADNMCHVFPVGPSVFKSVFAPADYLEAVNTDGQPFYSKMEERLFAKGYDLEVQSNPVHLCMYPEALIAIKGA